MYNRDKLLKGGRKHQFFLYKRRLNLKSKLMHAVELFTKFL